MKVLALSSIQSRKLSLPALRHRLIRSGRRERNTRRSALQATLCRPRRDTPSMSLPRRDGLPHVRVNVRRLTPSFVATSVIVCEPSSPWPVRADSRS